MKANSVRPETASAHQQVMTSKAQGNGYDAHRRNIKTAAGGSPLCPCRSAAMGLARRTCEGKKRRAETTMTSRRPCRRRALQKANCRKGESRVSSSAHLYIPTAALRAFREGRAHGGPLPRFCTAPGLRLTSAPAHHFQSEYTANTRDKRKNTEQTTGDMGNTGEMSHTEAQRTQRRTRRDIGRISRVVQDA